MGLGLSATCVLHRPRGTGILTSIVRIEDLISALNSIVEKTPLGFYAHGAQGRTKSSYLYYLHPAEEPVFIEVEGNKATLSAKTSSAGPGYHAFLVSLIERGAADVGVRWEWTGDATTYSATRDYVALQAEMAGFLKQLVGILAERRTRSFSGQMLAMPVGFSIAGFEDDIITPLGPVAWNDFETAQASQGAALGFAERYFSWWENGFGADFFRGLALRAMWQDISWSSPAGNAERNEIKRVLAWCDRVGTGEPSLPAPAVAELRELALSNGPRNLPNTEGIGYRRHFVRRTLPGQWEIQVPGSLLELEEDNGETVVFWNDDITVRDSSLTATLKEPKPYEANRPADRKIKIERDGEESISLSAIVSTHSDATTQQDCIVSVWIRNASLQPIAERVLSSINFIQPKR